MIACDIEKQVRLNNQCDKLSKEYMESIKVLHVFINSSSEIVHTYKTIHKFNNNTKNTIYSSDIHNFYKDNRTLELVKYDFNQFLVYNVDIDNKLYTNIDSISTLNFLQGYTYIRDVVINPSLFIFHKINSILMIYKEHKESTTNMTLKNRKLHSSHLKCTAKIQAKE
jgi:hypothetical protein